MESLTKRIWGPGLDRIHGRAPDLPPADASPKNVRCAGWAAWVACLLGCMAAWLAWLAWLAWAGSIGSTGLAGVLLAIGSQMALVG